MRTKLKAIEGQRAVFRGRVERFSSKRAYRGADIPTVLLSDVREGEGTVVTDHLWFNQTQAFAALDLRVGDTIEFQARVKAYEKGYKGRREEVWDKSVEQDNKLSYPTRVRRCS